MSSFWFCEIQKSDIPPRKIEKALMICKFSIDIRPFSAIFGVKNTLVNPSIFPFLDVILDEIWIFYPIILMAFLVQFLIFPKKTDFQVKKFKKTESPKMVSKRL